MRTEDPIGNSCPNSRKPTPMAMTTTPPTTSLGFSITTAMRHLPGPVLGSCCQQMAGSAGVNAGSVGVDAGCLDHRLPLGDLGLEMLVERCRSGLVLGNRLGPQVGEALQHVLILQRALKCRGKLVDGRLRRSGGRVQP